MEKQKRIFSATSNNVEVQISDWGTVYVDGVTLESILKENIEKGTFRAKINISIEEVDGGLNVWGNKEQPKEEAEDEAEGV